MAAKNIVKRFRIYIWHTIQTIWLSILHVTRPVFVVPLHLFYVISSLVVGVFFILPYHLLCTYTRLPVKKTVNFFFAGHSRNQHEQFCIVAVYDKKIRHLFEDLTKEWQSLAFAVGEICLELVYFGIFYVLGVPIILKHCTPAIENFLTKFCTANGYYNKQRKTPYSIINVVAPEFTIDKTAAFFPYLSTPQPTEPITDSSGIQEKSMSNQVQLDSIWSNTKLINYQAYVLSMCSKLAYEHTDMINDVLKTWRGFEMVGDFKSPKPESEKAVLYSNMAPETYSYISTTDRAIIITFRGSAPLNLINWVTDFSGELHSEDGVEIHGGFYRALTYSSGIDKPSVYNQLIEKIKFLQNLTSSKRSIYITGHSLGAALASVFTTLCFKKEESLSQYIDGVYTFGQPRSGNLNYCTFVNESAEKFNCKIYRFVHSTDIITRLPPRSLQYVHHGRAVYLDGLNGIHIVNDQIQGVSSNEYVFRLLLSTYKLVTSRLRNESWLRLCSRFVLFFVPGFSDHFPSDYALVLHENVDFPSGETQLKNSNGA